MKRLNTDKSIAPIVAQFVPIKLDIKSDEYREWRKDHKYEGRTIPILFVVRADGATLYGKSGSLSGQALPAMLTRALENSGQIIGAKEAEVLVSASNKFELLKSEGQIQRAIKALNRASKFGLPGKIPSYANAAVKVNDLAIATSSEVLAKIEELDSTIESGSEEEKLEAILAALKLKREYSALKLVKTELANFQKKLNKRKKIGQLIKEARVIDGALAATSKTALTRSKGKLEELINSSLSDAVKAKARKVLAEMAD